ncbi:heparin lyase I family protein [Paenibacillus sp. F411]|uniref:heparin lyase I family protein n=1 Tax=Paenibacillus sp. F411 TaxID=2820239 RepID=UPI001AAF7C5A|nr:heparin lyase I family protein [Paenibacillus sp. F411]MBO2942411.1 heparin lyase I family protein [Paenibacillus sp. F411]
MIKRASKQRFLSMLFVCAMSSTLLTSVHADPYNLYETFEDQTWDYTSEPQKNNPYALNIINNPTFGAYEGSRVQRFQWDRVWYDASDRATKGSEIAQPQVRAAWNQDIWEEFYFYFPSSSDGMSNDSKGMIIKQWIAWHPSIPNTNKSFAFTLQNGVLKAQRAYGDRVNPSYQDYTITSNIPKDQWVKFKLNLRFDRTGSSGKIKVWMNDSLKVDVSGFSMGVGSPDYGPYTKYGIYAHSSSDFTKRVFFADKIKWSYNAF